MRDTKNEPKQISHAFASSLSFLAEASEERRQLIEEYAARKKLEKELFEKASKEKILAEQNIEREYWDKELCDYMPKTRGQEEMLKATKTLIENKRGKILASGKNGVGKTFMGAMAVKALGGRLFSMYEISTMIRQSYSSLAQRTELEIVAELSSVPMLVIDEIGRTNGSASEQNWLSHIIDKRHTRGLPLMVLTNRHLSINCPKGGCGECLENFLGSDSMSRLSEDSKIIIIENGAPDFRQAKNKQN